MGRWLKGKGGLMNMLMSAQSVPHERRGMTQGFFHPERKKEGIKNVKKWGKERWHRRREARRRRSLWGLRTLEKGLFHFAAVRSWDLILLSISFSLLLFREGNKNGPNKDLKERETSWKWRKWRFQDFFKPSPKKSLETFFRNVRGTLSPDRYESVMQ